jgi:DNA-directed RNA polymerase subunit RPC12/RpoP
MFFSNDVRGEYCFMNDKIIIKCVKCGKLLNVPADRGSLNVRCPYCQSQFIWTPNIYQKSKAWYVINWRSHWPSWLKISAAVGVLISGIALAIYFQDSLNNNVQPQKLRLLTQSTTHHSQLVRINYDDLIDRGIITHSGQTIGNLLNKIASTESSRSTSFFSELQPYLEPFSFICNDIVISAKSGDVMPYVNVVADYQAGSRQPAWAALFREGNYQLFVGNGKARLFLKGESPLDLFNRYYSVIRHPLREALATIGADKMTVEVYAFQNDYPSRTITLDLIPHVIEIAVNQLGPKSKELPLADLAVFFNQGIILEAAEINEKGDFYLYGIPSARQTIATQPQSLEDFAVVYRSMFHCGNNAPYISLDRHEDNRYAKVNFGGLLEDTRVGSVVLEADKLFKTLSTGLDPNSRAFIKGRIVKEVPGFLTEDERALKGEGKGHSEIRYWFYPDHIQSATDGRLGVVQNYQFMADAERMDIKVALGRAQRDTIDHLNRNLAD